MQNFHTSIVSDRVSPRARDSGNAALTDWHISSVDLIARMGSFASEY
jgi:hypothetical protein